ncbi:unnamed protein product [Staurois parvus]|uniref:Uncharacterized protein n=1 Tax=Staurois parvus TaxID=386267 RepID=A0ABN9D6J1_9NEOB|nr:unnamed protein product [Staurois parvus]
MKRLLKTKDKPSKGPGEASRFLKPPIEPVIEPESPYKGSEVTLRRSKSSVSVDSHSFQMTPTRFRRAKLSSTIRSTESFNEADSTPRDKFRLRRKAQFTESEGEDTASERRRQSKGEESKEERLPGGTNHN